MEILVSYQFFVTGRRSISRYYFDATQCVKIEPTFKYKSADELGFETNKVSRHSLSNLKLAVLMLMSAGAKHYHCFP